MMLSQLSVVKLLCRPRVEAAEVDAALRVLRPVGLTTLDVGEAPLLLLLLVGRLLLVAARGLLLPLDLLALAHRVPRLDGALLLLAEVLTAVDHGLDEHVDRCLGPKVLVVHDRDLGAVEDGVDPRRARLLGHVLDISRLERRVDARKLLEPATQLANTSSKLEGVIGIQVELQQNTDLPQLERCLHRCWEHTAPLASSIVQPSISHAKFLLP
mmetsp:Transcript_29775/g.62652  ORF Transcript_29775/g.62652 Transcript_29775/m.62652 type:complete len:213 (+) Transcript_29775:527-1165(+)